MAVGIELARAMEPLTFFQMEVFNTQSAIRYKSATQLNTLTYCEKTRYPLFRTRRRATRYSEKIYRRSVLRAESHPLPLVFYTTLPSFIYFLPYTCACSWAGLGCCAVAPVRPICYNRMLAYQQPLRITAQNL
jgi:hypothetical protein